MLESKKDAFTKLVQDAQAKITAALEAVDGEATFQIDNWEREGFGFGSTRVIENGAVFEKGGVNVSAVAKELPKAMQEHLDEEESDFFVATDQRVMESNQAEIGIIEPQLQADGKKAWLETNKIPIHDSKGHVIGILGTYQDITERIEKGAEHVDLAMDDGLRNRGCTHWLRTNARR